MGGTIAIKLLSGNLKVTDHFRRIDVNRRTILKWALKEEDMTGWTRLH
jgi:hypothetical protein